MKNSSVRTVSNKVCPMIPHEGLNQLRPMSDVSDENFRRLGGEVHEKFAGKRLDSYLSENFPFLSRSEWQKRIVKMELLVNQIPAKVSYRIRKADILHMYHPEFEEPEADETVELLWEKSGIMAVSKGAPLPMHENGAYRKKTLAALLIQKFGPEWSAVHRLDRETSGVVLCAARMDLRRKLAEQFEEHLIKKDYLALCRNHPAHSNWICDAPLGGAKNSAIRIKKWVDNEKGIFARTDFSVKKLLASHCLVHAMPKTGRTNQIRIHAAYSGIPLLGDKLYHENEEVFLKFYDEGNTTQVQAMAGFRRHCLHAWRISFLHPELGKQVEVEAPLAKDMDLLVKELEQTQ